MSYSLFPQTIKLPDSRINKNICLLRYLGSTTLTVDGLIESGDIMTSIWEKGIFNLLPRTFVPQKVLLLGFAGGCNAKLINRYFPQADITAVEIDPNMITIGRKYFAIDRIKNLNIVIGDAVGYVDKLKPSQQFDLVMVDCFVGQKIPRRLEKLSFIKKLKKQSRFVLINRLWWGKEKDVTARFLRHLSSSLFFVKTHTNTNVLISLV